MIGIEGFGSILLKVTAALLFALSLSVFYRRLDPRWRVHISRACLLIVPITIVTHLLGPTWGISSDSVPEMFHPLLGVSSSGFVASEGRSNLFSWASILLFVWLAGAIFNLARELLGLFSILLQGSRATSSSNKLQKLWDSVSEDFGVQNATISVLSGEQSPFITFSSGGILVVVPESFEKDSPEEVERIIHAMRHEAAHIKSLDHVWVLLMRFAMCLAWFHPLMWWLVSEHLRACEEAADAEAARIGGVEKYRQAIAALALNLVPVNQAVTTSLIRLPNLLSRLNKLRKTSSLKPPSVFSIGSVLLPYVCIMVGLNLVQVEAKSGVQKATDYTMDQGEGKPVFKVLLEADILYPDHISAIGRKKFKEQLMPRLQGADLESLGLNQEAVMKAIEEQLNSIPDPIK